MNHKILLLALAATIIMSCKTTKEPEQAPITKPQITITGGRLTPEALWAMGRISTAVPDPETGWIAYTVSYYSVEENRSSHWIRIAEQQGDSLHVLDEFLGSDPAWFGGSGVLAYLKGGQLCLRQHGQDIPVTGYDEDIEGFLLSPMRDQVVLISQVKTIPSTEDKYPDLPKASGRVVDDLMYKHWDEWTETAPQPFICQLQVDYKNEMDVKSASVSHPVNILEGTPYESPMKPFGGVEQLAWAPNNHILAYTCRKKSGLDYALSTNSDIYTYDILTREHANLTEGMMGYDTNPIYSPSGQYIAWLSMERDGYESDQNRLFIMDNKSGEKTFASRALDTDINEYFWVNDSTIILSACWHGEIGIYQLDVASSDIQLLRGGQYDYIPIDLIGDKLYYLRHSMCEANEIFVGNLNDNHNDNLNDNHNDNQLTFENKNIYDQITMGTVIPRWQKTTQGEDMLTWIILPPYFDPNKKYPTLLYCEGGPQSPVSQFWSFRWNFMMMAANDYVIVAPNRHGLPGFGKAWCEEISGDYGGQCMRDYLSAIDEACQNLPYVDKNHLGCVGASFGGFSVYWLAGHHQKRFKAFIAHDGIFNMEMQYLETEEKWFANWDMGGAYWDKSNATAQRTFANSPHKFVDQWDTPILCIHGEKDYRILANQGMAAFDAAKMRGVPAQLLIFPDENHWVLKPQNGILWQRTFFAWLDKWLKEGQSK